MPRGAPKSDFDRAMEAAAAVVTDQGVSDSEPEDDPEVAQIRAIMAQADTPALTQPQAVRQMTLAEKLATIMLEIPEDLQPAEWNEKQGYWFWSIEQITGLLRHRFAAAGILFLPNVLSYDIRERTTARGGSSWMTTMMVQITLLDALTGEELTRTSIGQGDDAGDKGSNKAFTGAVKTWLKYLFLIGGKDDAELDETTDDRYDSRDRGPYRDSDRVADSRRDDRRDDRDPVTVEGSDIQGIERGGHATRATEVQVTRVRTLAREAGISLNGLVDVIDKTLQDHLDLPRDPGEARDTILAYLARLSPESIGQLIAELSDLAASARSGALDDDPGYGG